MRSPFVPSLLIRSAFIRSLSIPTVLGLIAIILAPAPALAATALAARMQRSARFYRDHDGFMGMVAVQRNHHLIYRAGFGFANLEKQIPFTPKTQFRIGSLSKQFTATAILLLQQEGKLKTSDPIAKYY